VLASWFYTRHGLMRMFALSSNALLFLRFLQRLHGTFLVVVVLVVASLSVVVGIAVDALHYASDVGYR
jgi:hypothetical protein